MNQIIIENLQLKTRIGIYDIEKQKLQLISISIWCDYDESFLQKGDYVCYKTLCDQIKDYLRERHIDLVEQLAEKLIEIAFRLHPSIFSVRAQVKKLQAIPECAAVGVEMKRRRSESNSLHESVLEL